MSVEYTIDIQLTELGFPDILQPQQPPDAPTVCSTPTAAHSISSQKKSLLAEHKRQCQTDSHAIETPVARQAAGTGQVPVAAPLSVTSVSGAVGNDDTAGKESPNTRQENHRETVARTPSTGVQDHNNDSSDSEVSDVYEEEELVEEEEEDPPTDSSHSGDYSCSVCHLKLPSRFKLQDHMNLHTGARPYCCAECGKRFCQTSSYLVHLRTHAVVKVVQHQCRICRKGFASVVDLSVHFSKTHLEKQFYECDLCKSVYTLKEDCMKHVELRECLNKFACEVCNRKFSCQKMLKSHRKKVCNCNFKCTDCSETFTEKKTLLKHSFTHLGLLPYTCVRCHQHFRLAKLYCRHKCEPERIHCVACLREFSSHSDFQQHKKDTGCWGSQERNAKTTEIRCLECGQRFATAQELKKHAGAHQRVLKCAECWKGFRSALLLMSHMGGHAGQSPCLCQSCGLGFPYQQNYDSHLKTCGQLSPAVTGSKKRKTSKSSSSTSTAEADKPPAPQKSAKVLIERLPCKIPAKAMNKATVTLNPVTVMSPPPQTGECRPAPLIAGVPTCAASSEGLWKLTLDKPPPPRVDLVMFLPVHPSPTSEVLLTSAIPPNLALAAIPAVSQTTVPTVPTNGYFGVNPAFGMQPNTPGNLSCSNQENFETPLDLSLKKIDKQKVNCSPDLCVKSESEEFEISEEVSITQRHLQNHARKMIVETEGDGRTNVKLWKIEQVIHSQLDVEPACLEPVVDVRQKPKCPDEICSSEANEEPAECEPEKIMKTEVES